MAATVQINETNGDPGTETSDVQNLNMGSADQAELTPSNHPIVAQADGHSYEKWVRFYVSDLGGNSKIDNLKVWLSDLGGGFKTGEGMSTNVRESSYSEASYPSGGPTNSDSTVATETMPTSEPSGANVGIAGSLSGEITSVPAYSDFMVFQLDVTENTPAGAMNTKTFTFQWDEQ